MLVRASLGVQAPGAARWLLFEFPFSYRFLVWHSRLGGADYSLILSSLLMTFITYVT